MRAGSAIRPAVVALVVVTSCAGAGRPTLSEDTAPPRECSADGMVIADVDAEGIPPEVAATRAGVIDAATACDFDALAQLAALGPLAVVIDGAEAPVDGWERRERAGEPILQRVAGVLALTPAGSAADGSVTWPSAVDWPFSDVAPGDERRALVDVVGEDGVFGWAETGGYAGWRTTIAGDGTWASVLLGPAPG